MTLFLLSGFILVVAMIGSIPMYTDAILQRMLTGDLEAYQLDHGEYPGYYRVKANLQYFEDGEKISSYANLKKNLRDRLVPEIPLPLVTSSEEVFVQRFFMVPAIQREEEPKQRLIAVYTRPDLADHVVITRGRMFSPRSEGGTIETIVMENFLRKNGVYLNEELASETLNGESFGKIRIVGVFAIKDLRDTYWRTPPEEDTCFIDYSLFQNEILEKGLPFLNDVEWNFAFDYHRITIRAIGALNALLAKHNELAASYGGSLRIDFSTASILEHYSEREKQLRLTLWIIEIPVLILLFFYVFMVSNLIITNERNEIAVLKSRGKSSGQVFFIYLLESLILCALSLISGPPFGLFICRLMGASNGFLEFVQRASLKLSITCAVYAYSLAALIFLVAVMMVPTWFASKRSIVQVKQGSREDGSPIWKRFFLDLVLLSVSAYGFSRYAGQRNLLRLFDTSGTEIGIDPLLFFTSTLFILGAGLLFLRIFPFLVRWIYDLGKKYWSPTMYCALLQVARTGKRGQFLMLFLIFSIAVGIFDANSARTLNRNVEDRTRYRIGADIVVRQEWLVDRQAPATGEEPDYTEPGEEASQVSFHYREPSFIPFTQLEGVEHATKVFTVNNGSTLVNDTTVSHATIQGIVPQEFGEIAWFRNDLLPYHWFNYLNLLSEARNAFLVGGSIRASMKLKVGDSISITWGNQDFVSGIIYGFVDFWPTFNPYASADRSGDSCLVVANLKYLQNKMANEAYYVWLKKKKNASDETVYAALGRQELKLLSVESANQELIRQKNDPLLKGINGALTQGFILIMLICTVGFLIYWAVSLQNRTLQFGILRAMGLSQGNVVRIIVLEQILMSGAAIFLGIFTGGIASVLFVPFLQLAFSSAEQIPPFTVIALRADYLKIYAIILAMLALGLFFLRFFMRRLKIGSALKLGED